MVYGIWHRGFTCHDAKIHNSVSAGRYPLNDWGIEIVKNMARLVAGIAIMVLVSQVCADAVIINHTCTDLSQIPDEWITEAKNPTIHYAQAMTIPAAKSTYLMCGSCRTTSQIAGYLLNCAC